MQPAVRPWHQLEEAAAVLAADPSRSTEPNTQWGSDPASGCLHCTPSSRCGRQSEARSLTETLSWAPGQAPGRHAAREVRCPRQGLLTSPPGAPGPEDHRKAGVHTRGLAKGGQNGTRSEWTRSLRNVHTRSARHWSLRNSHARSAQDRSLGNVHTQSTQDWSLRKVHARSEQDRSLSNIHSRSERALQNWTGHSGRSTLGQNGRGQNGTGHSGTSGHPHGGTEDGPRTPLSSAHPEAPELDASLWPARPAHLSGPTA